MKSDVMDLVPGVTPLEGLQNDKGTGHVSLKLQFPPLDFSEKKCYSILYDDLNDSFHWRFQCLQKKKMA